MSLFSFFFPSCFSSNTGQTRDHTLWRHTDRNQRTYIYLYIEREGERDEKKKKQQGAWHSALLFFFFVSLFLFLFSALLIVFFFFSGASTLTVCVHDCNLKARLPGKKPVERSLFCGRNARFTKKARNCKKKKESKTTDLTIKHFYLRLFIYLYIAILACSGHSFSLSSVLFSLFFFLSSRVMSFSPSTRGATECTSASKTAAVGGSSGGVSTAAAATPATVTTSGVARSSCGSPLHPSRTTVQRVNGGSGPPSPVPRGCSASSCNVGAAASATETAVAAGTTLRPTSPGVAPQSPVSVSLSPSCTQPHAMHSTAAPAGVQPSTYYSMGAPALSSSSSDIVLPLLTRTNPSRTSLSDALTAAPAKATSDPALFLPSIALPHAARGAVEAGEHGKASSTTQLRREPTASAPPSAEPQPSSLPTSSIVVSPTAPAAAAAAPRDVAAAAASTNDFTAASSTATGAGARAGGAGPPPPRPTGESYFRDNGIPHLFNELSEALLEARPENPVAFMAIWLRRRRDALH